VKLTPLKQRIFDVIRRSGPDGIYHDDLFGIIYHYLSASREDTNLRRFEVSLLAVT